MAQDKSEGAEARPTIKDIARVAGYSKTAVSFAFNDPERISREARERILEVATELGYIPDPVARNLTMKRLGTIGFLVPQDIPVAFQNPYVSEIFRGIGEVCNRHGFTLNVVPPRRGSMFEGVRNAAVDGFITLGLMPDMEIVQVIEQRHIPFVTIDGQAASDIASVSIDDTRLAEMITDHVLSYGHRRIGILAFSPWSRTGEAYYSGIGEKRFAGIAQALGKVGLSLESPQVRMAECECSSEGGAQGAEELFREGERPTAVIAMSDIMAIGAYKTLRAHGLRVPRDVSVTGFDDIPEATFVTPELTTIGQPGYEKGRQAGNMLLSLLAGEQIRVQEELVGHLIVRNSVGPAPPQVQADIREAAEGESDVL